MQDSSNFKISLSLTGGIRQVCYCPLCASMPPPGSRQPQQAEVDAFVHSLEDSLDVAARPVAGHVPIQRMTRTEFGIAVKDLLGVEIDAENLLPTEIEVGGFDNIAAALSIS